MKISVEQTPKQSLSENVINSVNSVSIVHLPGVPLSNTVPTINALRRKKSNLKIIPHIAARNLKNKKELYENCKRFADLGVKNILVVGGSKQYGSCYGNAFDILKDIEDADYQFNFLCGIYPHKETPTDVELKKYTKFSKGITQICLNAKLLRKFNSNTTIGVPSNCDIKSLIKFAKICGITKTTKEIISNLKGLKYISYSGFNTYKFVKNLNDQFDIHVFNFGKLDKTINSLKKL